jgi:hypothetical protein
MALGRLRRIFCVFINACNVVALIVAVGLEQFFWRTFFSNRLEGEKISLHLHRN